MSVVLKLQRGLQRQLQTAIPDAAAKCHDEVDVGGLIAF